MDYKEKYNKLVNAIKVLQETNPSDEGIQNWVNDNVLELRESEDEKIRKRIILCLEECVHDDIIRDYEKDECIAWIEKQGDNLVKNGYTDNKDVIKYANKYSHEIWHKLMDNYKNIKDYHIGCNDVSDIVLNTIIDTYNWLEKQGEHADFRNKIQIGDKVTRNEDGVLVNLSQLNRVAKKYEKQGLKSAWSEEDEGFLNLLLAVFTNEHPNGIFSTDNIPVFNGNCVTSNRIISWLKSLKDRYTWKPTSAQMKALDSAIDEFDGYQEFGTLVSLKEDLEKLKRE